MVGGILSCVLLAGCMGDFGDFDLGDGGLVDLSGLGNIGGGFGSVGGASGRPFELFDDGTTLLVTACDQRGAFGGCQTNTGETRAASAMIDGQLLDVPVDTKVKLWPEEPIGWFEHRLEVASPSDPVVELDQRPFELLPAFAVTAGSQASRSAGVLEIEYEVLPEAGAIAITVTRCGESRRVGDIIHPSEPGRFELQLGDEVGCTYEVRISQRVYQRTSWTVPTSDGGTATVGFNAEVNRIVSVPIASEPVRI